MKSVLKLLFLSLLFSGILGVMSCDEDLDDTKDCTGCPNDAPFGTIDGSNCYTTESACESAESGNCVICQ